MLVFRYFRILCGGDFTFLAVFLCFSGVTIRSWTCFWNLGLSDFCAISFAVSPSELLSFLSDVLVMCPLPAKIVDFCLKQWILFAPANGFMGRWWNIKWPLSISVSFY